MKEINLFLRNTNYTFKWIQNQNKFVPEGLFLNNTHVFLVPNKLKKDFTVNIEFNTESPYSVSLLKRYSIEILKTTAP